jgi:acyl-CoA synthetase (AMP-forming)/AMP-acid ligase II
VLELEDTAEALLWMVALDGLAKAVFLVPASVSEDKEYPALKKAFCPDITIDDKTISEWRRIAPVAGSRGSVTSWDTEWILATSGTTGTPKLVGHSTLGLMGTVKSDPARGREFVWGLVYEAFRFAGLQVVLQALVGGSRLVICDPKARVNEQAAFLRRSGVNALSATPTYWRRVLMSGVVQDHQFRQITLGGEAADQQILDALAARFPEARITHIYASTEAGVGFSVSDGRAGFPADFLRAGVAGRAMAIGEEGTLQIAVRGDLPESMPVEQAGFLDTGDLVEVRNDRVYFVGRRSGTINVGGNKVVPEQVEAVIRQVEGVADAVVKAKASSVTGQLVVADVVPWSSGADTTALRKAVVGHCKAVLARYQVPALIRFVEQIESNPSGKASRV